MLLNVEGATTCDSYQNQRCGDFCYTQPNPMDVKNSWKCVGLDMENSPQRLHSVWDLLWRLPKDEVPFASIRIELVELQQRTLSGSRSRTHLVSVLLDLQGDGSC